MLRRNRVADDQQNCNQCNPTGGHSSPNKTSQGKNWDHAHGTKSGSPQKVSPTKQGAGTKFTDSSHTNNGQVMTQISAIYAKRSRSILNQFGQTNHGAQAHHIYGPTTNVAVNNNYLNPNNIINQGRGSVGVNNDAHDGPGNPNKGSPRLGRLRGISPQSREKAYMSGSNNNGQSGSTNNSNLNYSQNMS